MRRRRTIAVLVAAGTVALTGCAYGVIAAGAAAAKMISTAKATSPSSDFQFNSVTWVRTPTDTNSLTVRGVLTWTKSRAGVKNTQYWDVSPQSGGQGMLSMDLIDAEGRTMTTVRGALTVREGKEHITMVPFGKPVSFEFRTMPISPNVARAIQTVMMKGYLVRTM